MTIKEIFNIRISRIKEYAKHVYFCNDMKRVLGAMENAITSIVDPGKVDDTYVCRKVYYTTMPATNTYETGDNVYHHVKYCHRFNDGPCPIFNCPYNDKNVLYKNQENLLRQAMIDKRLSFKRIFQRIK